MLKVAQQTSKQILQRNSTKVILCLFSIILLYAGIIGKIQYNNFEKIRIKYQNEVRSSWVNSPDKHPHRMAHYGYIAFRPKSALSVFDYGLESYLGNAIFLEAHKQNTTNFSEASLSTTMMRFGEISIAMILQLLFPLLIFFLGHNVISSDRENGTLKILIAQGLNMRSLIIGKILGVLFVSSIIFIPTFIYSAILHFSISSFNNEWTNFLCAFLLYSISIIIYSCIAVCVSAISNKSKLALVSLIGLWLILFVALPRSTQAFAEKIYPTPSKIAFESGIEEEIIKEGDSHNPDDKHYKNLKDSILRTHHAVSIEQLNFNYAGFQMKEGERISSQIYNKHKQNLNRVFKNQNNLMSYTGFLNPYICIKEISLLLSNTDFETYLDFQEQAEKYRYELAQEMNDLQIKLIPNKKLSDTAKTYSISKHHWATLKDFNYTKPKITNLLKNNQIPILALIYWIILTIVILIVYPNKIKVL